MRTFTKMAIACDVSADSFAGACGLLNVLPQEATLIFPWRESGRAQKIADEYRCKLLGLHSDMLKTEFTWGAMDADGNCVWSQGV